MFTCSQSRHLLFVISAIIWGDCVGFIALQVVMPRYRVSHPCCVVGSLTFHCFLAERTGNFICFSDEMARVIDHEAQYFLRKFKEIRIVRRRHQVRGRSRFHAVFVPYRTKLANLVQALAAAGSWNKAGDEMDEVFEFWE